MPHKSGKGSYPAKPGHPGRKPGMMMPAPKKPKKPKAK